MLSSFSVRRPYTVIVAAIVVIILGVVSLTNISTDLLPGINLPYAVVVTTYTGASPEEVEMIVTRPIEQRMASISNIKSVRSVSREGMSVVILEFGENANMDSIVIEMRENLDMIKAYMPDNAGTPIIMKLNPDMLPLMVVSAAVKGQSIGESSSFLESRIIPELESIEGVASVSAAGLVDNQIHVILREEKIKEVNDKVKQAVQEAMQQAMQQASKQQQALLEMQAQGQSQSQDTQTPQSQQVQQVQQPAQERQAQQAQQVSQAQQVPQVSQVPQESQVQQMQQVQQLQQTQGMPRVPEINITKEMVAGILKGQNFSMPAGYITEDGVDYLVRTGDKIKDIEELKSLTILAPPIPGMEPVTLDDVAEITVFDSTKDRYSKVNGNDAIILSIQKQTEYATSNIAKSIRQRIADIMKRYEGVEIVPLMDQGEYIDIVVDSIALNLILGGALAVLVLALFLRDLRPTIIIAVSIPLSLVTAFVLMYFSNITLNIISLGGLALGVGMLVDNSIVVIENIYRMRNEEGRSPKEAAVEGAKQVAGAITSSTLTTVAVFAPILFTQGLTRQIFADMGLTITFSLLASLLVALTLVPVMASGVLAKENKKKRGIFESMKKGYNRLLRFSLKHKWVVLLITLALFAGSIIGAFRIGTELIPSADSGQLMVDLSFEKGSSFQDMAETADKVMEVIMGIDEVETVGASMGGGFLGMGAGMGMAGQGGGRSGSAGSVSYYVRLKNDRARSTDEVAQLIRESGQKLNAGGFGFEISVSSSGMDISMLSGGTIAINIKGREFDTLEKIARDVAEIVLSVEGTTDVTDGIEDTAPELRIVVDKEKSIAKGLTVAQVFMEINKLLAGESVATSISIENKDYDVLVKDEREKSGITKSDIMDFKITSPQGEEVSIRDIASIGEARGFSAINRTNQQRYVTVRAELEEGYNIGLVSNQINSKLAEYQAPEGYTIEMSGERRMISETFRDLFFMPLIAIAFIYLIMVAQFQSLLSPFIIMFTIPLAFTGGFLALIITGNPVSTISFIGLIILAGVVVNNGIVFVDYVNKMREAGMSKTDAIYKAGNDRIRPILMTALTTVFGLSTMSMGTGMGTEVLQPMAITAIGGLIYATFLTLILVPVLYDSFHKSRDSHRTAGDLHGK